MRGGRTDVTFEEFLTDEREHIAVDPQTSRLYALADARLMALRGEDFLLWSAHVDWFAPQYYSSLVDPQSLEMAIEYRMPTERRLPDARAVRVTLSARYLTKEQAVAILQAAIRGLPELEE